MACKEKNKVAAVVETQRQVYEAAVVNRMNGRCGVTPKGAKGIVLEVLDIDQQNLKDVLKPGRHTQLTKNPNAPQLDAVTLEKGKVVRRLQYKDITSASGLEKTVKQVADGKYDQATLRGTKEAAKAFNDRAADIGIKKHMESTGISTKDTTRIADKYLAVEKGYTPTNVGAHIGNAAKSSALGAAGLTAAIELGKGIVNGDDAATTASAIVTKGSESAVSGFVAGAAGEAAFLGVAAVFPPAAVPAAIVSGIVAGTVTNDVVDGAFDTVGEIVEDVVDSASDLISDIKSELSFWKGFFLW